MYSGDNIEYGKHTPFTVTILKIIYILYTSFVETYKFVLCWRRIQCEYRELPSNDALVI